MIGFEQIKPVASDHGKGIDDQNEGEEFIFQFVFQPGKREGKKKQPVDDHVIKGLKGDDIAREYANITVNPTGGKVNQADEGEVAKQP